MMFGIEPSRMIEQVKRRPIAFVMSVEILHENLVDAVVIRRIRAGVTH